MFLFYYDFRAHGATPVIVTSASQLDPSDEEEASSIGTPSRKLYNRAAASEGQGVRDGTQLQGKSFPKTRCCVTGSFPKTSVRYKRPSCSFTLLQDGNPDKSERMGECSANGAPDLTSVIVFTASR